MTVKKLTSLLLFMFVTQANAALIDFEEIPAQTPEALVSQGFRFTSDLDKALVSGFGGSLAFGCNAFCTLEMEQAQGNLFDLASIELRAAALEGPASNTFTLTGYFAQGGPISLEVELNTLNLNPIYIFTPDSISTH